LSSSLSRIEFDLAGENQPRSWLQPTAPESRDKFFSKLLGGTRLNQDSS